MLEVVGIFLVDIYVGGEIGVLIFRVGISCEDPSDHHFY